MISGDRGADLLSTNEENAGSPSAAWMIGGLGVDTYVGSANAQDIVSYGDSGRIGNVTARLDCIPNDGNFTADGGYKNVGCSTTSIEGLEGSVNDDYIVGDGAGNQLYGLAGNDNIKGGDLTDSLSGGNGNDTLEGGTGSDFYWGDESPFDRDNDGTTGDGGGGGDDDGANPGDPPRCLVAPVPVTDTTKTCVVADLTGYTLDELALLFWLGGVNADFRGSKALFALRKLLPKHPRGERYRNRHVQGGQGAGQQLSDGCDR